MEHTRLPQLLIYLPTTCSDSLNSQSDDEQHCSQLGTKECAFFLFLYQSADPKVTVCLLPMHRLTHVQSHWPGSCSNMILLCKSA